jgi:hypothetical protein
MNGRGVGATQDFVLAGGFQEVGGFTALLARDGSRRLLAEISVDPDRPEARSQEAYSELLASLAPGWTARLLQVTWPDPEPRQAFLAGMESWEVSDPADPGGHAGQDGPAEVGQALGLGLRLFLEGFPLPFRRRALLEFVLPPGEEALGWWGGAAGVLARHGLELTPLRREEILDLARQLLDPELD